MTPNEVTAKLKKIREARGISQATLSKKIGIGQARLSEIETKQDHQVKLATLNKIAHALGYTVDLQLKKIPDVAR